MMPFKINAEFDVFELEMWGNKKDGWEQNNQFHLGVLSVPCLLDGSVTETDILKAMKKMEIRPVIGRPYKALSTRNRRKVYIEDQTFGDGYIYEIGDVKTGQPVYRLIEKQEEPTL